MGLISLVGLIAKFGLMIVQFATPLQEPGVEKLVGMRVASLTRLRPVLMTASVVVPSIG